jgi:hypothetical protein
MTKNNVSISFGLMWLMCDLFVMSTCMNVHQYTVVPRTNDFFGMFFFKPILVVKHQHRFDIYFFSRDIYMFAGYLRFERVKTVPFLCPSCSCLAQPDMIRKAVPGA